MSALTAAGLSTLKWLKWGILCYFTTHTKVGDGDPGQVKDSLASRLGPHTVLRLTPPLSVGHYAGRIEACVPCPAAPEVTWAMYVPSGLGRQEVTTGNQAINCRCQVRLMRKGTACWCAPVAPPDPASCGGQRCPPVYRVNRGLWGGTGAWSPRRGGRPVWSPRPGPALAADPSRLPDSLPGGSTPPTCRARTCTPRGSTTSARSRCPCTGTATTACSLTPPRPFISHLF